MRRRAAIPWRNCGRIRRCVGGFSANFLPLASIPCRVFTQSAAQIIDPTRTVNPLCNWFFTSASCLVIIGVGTWITDRVIEPRLRNVPVDGETPDASATEPLTPRERRALWVSLGAVGLGLGGLTLAAWPAGSPLRSASGSLTAHGAPLMDSIIGLIFLLFLVPGVTYGIIVGTVRNHRDVIKAMSHSMSTMGYYLVMAFAAAQFTYARIEPGRVTGGERGAVRNNRGCRARSPLSASS